jgi:hypothetical protein
VIVIIKIIIIIEIPPIDIPTIIIIILALFDLTNIHISTDVSESITALVFEGQVLKHPSLYA